MASFNSNAFQSSSSLSVWFKVRSGQAMSLADVPEIIPLRWTYFRDTWPTLRQRLVNLATSYFDPDFFRATLDDLDMFIQQQQLASTDKNPFSGTKIYYRFFPLFDSLLVEQISLSSEESALVQNKKTLVAAFSKNDFLNIKKNITAYRDQLADSVGLGDADYNRIYNRSAVTSQLVPNISDLNLMQVLQGQIGSVDFVLANLFAIDAAIDPFAIARQNANNPDVKIGQYSSGFLVRLNYGEDLSRLAAKHLGDPDKWIDIAIANGLREPYIDETGVKLFLISNARGNQINIGPTAPDGSENLNKFYINQPILIQSTTLPFSSQRLITGIKAVPVSGEIVLTLSGAADLDQYTLHDTSSIRVFKPNTVNSSQFVLIPSTTPLPNNRQEEIPWFLAGAAADEKNMKIDIAISDTGALSFTSSGDVALSYGLANAVQAARLKLQVEQGSNRYHPKFGLVNVVGSPNTQDGDVKKALTDSVVAQIEGDSRFERIESINVERRGDSASAVAFYIDLSVRLAGSKTVIPITFSVTV